MTSAMSFIFIISLILLAIFAFVLPVMIRKVSHLKLSPSQLAAVFSNRRI